MIKGMAQEYPTSVGTSDADTITLLGQNLANDLMGKVGFGELTLWMVTQRRPTASEVRVFESVLVAAGVPCGPINTVDKGVEFAQKIGLEPIVTAGAGDRTRPTMRHPVTFSRTPASYPLAPPALDEQGDEIRAWLATEEG